MTTEDKAITTPDGQAPQKRERRTAEEVKLDHFEEILGMLSFEGKINLIKELKQQVATELSNREKLAKEAAELTNGI